MGSGAPLQRISAAFGGLEMENMNGVMTGIIEVKPASHGALDELVESPPFQGGIYGFEPHTHHQIGNGVASLCYPRYKRCFGQSEA